ncbi:NAD(P)H-quinone oxidoreductase [Nicoliella spurrieriana]|uniref:NAD(P)H-quinone oxidoreductase n=1 Tax=Nicoliella spurrieriana TaxID=2925830 RepID=A0A976RSA9_9LACO|nr:NAD(P)H-quinone oxidoreductase [Nicoliella spurrieriana]UQS86888.1 NAD(P)H-quinone oxidoreductase [Nicoliella spurrieriana]
MKAVTIHSLSQANPIVDVPNPEVTTGSVLIKVHATGVNHVDLAWATGKRKPADTVFGLEAAGEVIESKSNQVQVGQRVAALLDHGGYAGLVAVPAERIIPLPDEVSYTQGASIPESFLTAYQALFWIGQLKEHQTVLIHAGASAVGTAAIQLAKVLKHATVITTASTAKTKVCKQFGADYTIDYKTQDFEAEVDRITEHQGVDLILDFIGKNYFQSNLNALHFDGRIVLIGDLSGSIVDQFNLRYIMVKRASITGTMLSPRSAEYKARLTQAFVADTKQLFADGTLKPSVSATFDLADALAAQQFMADQKNVGKIVIKV